MRAALAACCLRGSLDGLAGSVGGNFGSVVAAGLGAVGCGSVYGSRAFAVVDDLSACGGGIGCGRAVILALASCKSEDHSENHDECKNSLHLVVLLLTFFLDFVNKLFHSIFSLL
jgi:hypothetical protein